MVIAFLMIILTVCGFWGYKKLHDYLDEEWSKNPNVPTPNGNGKNLKLQLINGIGFTLHGQYRHAMLGEYASYATYYTFCFFFIPIFSVRCYRVVPSENDGYYILGSEKTNFRELGCMLLCFFRWAIAAATILICISVFVDV